MNSYLLIVILLIQEQSVFQIPKDFKVWPIDLESRGNYLAQPYQYLWDKPLLNLSRV